MFSPKPTLGHPTRTAAALALRADGLDNRAIAERIGISVNALSGLLSNVDRRSGKHPPAERSERRSSRPGGTQRDYTSDSDRAKSEGITLAARAGQIAHRSTEQQPARTVEVRLSDADFARLIKAARADGQTPAEAARMFVRAGLALRGV